MKLQYLQYKNKLYLIILYKFLNLSILILIIPQFRPFQNISLGSTLRIALTERASLEYTNKIIPGLILPGFKFMTSPFINSCSFIRDLFVDGFLTATPIISV